MVYIVFCIWDMCFQELFASPSPKQIVSSIHELYLFSYVYVNSLFSSALSSSVYNVKSLRLSYVEPIYLIKHVFEWKKPAYVVCDPTTKDSNMCW